MNPEQRAPKRLLVDEASDMPDVNALLVRADLTSILPDEGIKKRAWNRFRAGVSGRSRTPRLRPVAVAVTVVAAVAGVVALQLRPMAKVVAVEGDVRLAGAAQPWELAKAGRSLGTASRVKTGDASHLSLQLANGCELALKARSEMELEALGRKTMLGLLSGELLIRVGSHPADVSFEVHAGRYTIRDVGTVFTVSRREQEITVSVQTGAVEILGDPETHWVGAGQTWSSAAPGGAPPAPVGGPAPLAAAPPLVAALPSAAREPIRVAKRLETQRSRIESKGVGATAPSPAPSLAAVPPEPYLAALSLDSAGRHLEAAHALEAIFRGGGSHADLALYELGRVRQRELNDSAGALEAFQQYRQRYPTGPLNAEVSLSIIELNLTLAKLASALDEMNGFLERYSSSERAEEVHLLRGNLLRDRGRFQDALADYGEVDAGSLAGDALYGSAYCEQALGRRERGVALLKDYLRRFPEGPHREQVSRALVP